MALRPRLVVFHYPSFFLPLCSSKLATCRGLKQGGNILHPWHACMLHRAALQKGTESRSGKTGTWREELRFFQGFKASWRQTASLCHHEHCQGQVGLAPSSVTVFSGGAHLPLMVDRRTPAFPGGVGICPSTLWWTEVLPISHPLPCLCSPRQAQVRLCFTQHLVESRVPAPAQSVGVTAIQIAALSWLACRDMRTPCGL